MKQTTKNILGVAAIVVLSAGVAGVTTYKMQNKEKSATFSELFQQNPNNLRLAAYNATDAQPVDLTQAAESSVHAVVHIRAKQLSKTQTVQSMPDIFDFFFGDGRGQQRQIQTQPRVGFGSGVIISKDGYIVTNNHVVDGAKKLEIMLSDGSKITGELVGKDTYSDLAVVKVSSDKIKTVAEFADSNSLTVGEKAIAIGSPLGTEYANSVTEGIVSSLSRTVTMQNDNGETVSTNAIQTDAAINPGNSGGALVNLNGELIGINTAILAPDGGNIGIGFAIPSNMVKNLTAQMVQYGQVKRGELGILGTELNSELAKAMKVDAQRGAFGDVGLIVIQHARTPGNETMWQAGRQATIDNRPAGPAQSRSRRSPHCAGARVVAW